MHLFPQPIMVIVETYGKNGAQDWKKITPRDFPDISVVQFYKKELFR